MIMKLIGLSLAAMVVGSGAGAAEIKCSDPTAVALVEDNIRTSLDAAFSQSDAQRAQRARVFPTGSFSLVLSEFLGTQADETSRDCSVKVTLASPGMKDGEQQFNYKVFRTEDDKILVTKDDRYLYALLNLGLAYDAANGLK